MRAFLEPGHHKAFINVCQSEIVSVATCSTTKGGTKKSVGTQWQIPYSLTPGRDDLDKSKTRSSNICITSLAPLPSPPLPLSPPSLPPLSPPPPLPLSPLPLSPQLVRRVWSSTVFTIPELTRELRRYESTQYIT